MRLIADVVRLWTEVQPVERILHNLLEGLFNSFGEIGLMQRVFTSSPDHFIKWIIAPLCSLRDSDDGLASYILGRIIDSVEMDVRDNRIMKLFQYKMVGTIFYCLYPDIDMFGKALRYLQITVNRGSLAEGAPRAIASTIMHLLINKFKIHCIKAHLSQLAIALNCNLDSTTGSFLSNGALHQILLPIIWELGGNQRHAAFQAFGIICMAFLQSRWDVLFPNDEKDRDQYYREAISEVLPTSFLFFMTNALQNMWHFMSPSKIIQSLKSLKVLITLLPKHHLSNYLPKVCLALLIVYTSRLLTAFV